MKTLVLSLLRMGDFLVQVPLLRELSKDQDVHVLINESTAPVIELFPEFQFHLFPRNLIQSLLVSKETPPLSSFLVLEDLMEELNRENFFEIQNWTHNYFSARLMDLLEAPTKKGIRYAEGRLVPLNHQEKYLNEHWGPSTCPEVHWTQALARAIGLNEPELPGADRHRQGPVYLQALTSDTKKNWPLKNWLSLSRSLQQDGFDVRFLCAPFEAETLREAGAQSLEVAEFSKLEPLLRNSSLLITGDTSVQHLAALYRTPLLSLFLGSADPYKTGPLLRGARILWSQTECAPCRHSENCSQPVHLCARELDRASVELEARSLLAQEPRALLRGGTRQMDVTSTTTNFFKLNELTKEVLCHKS